MAEEMKADIMPVELAIRREMAYREKLAGLYPEHDWEKELLPLEVPSSIGISSQYPSSALLSEPCSISVVNNPNHFPNLSCQNLSSIPRVLGEGPYPISDVASHTSRVQNLNPIPCSWSRVENLDMASNYSVNQATASSSNSLLYQHPRGLHIGDTNWFCRVCKVQCQTSLNYKQHVKGDKHKAKLQLQQMNRNGGGLDKPPRPRCSLCDIWCSDETSLESHLKGKKHQAKLMKIELGQKGAAAPNQLWCELCQIPCANEDTFRMHLDGKTHATRLQATRNNNRAI